MNLYNIHTHDVLAEYADDEGSKQNIVSIQNVSPLEFEYAKDSIRSRFFSCGVHPWYSEDAQPQIEFLKEIIADQSIIAVGETGYDKLKGPDLNTQKHIFEQQALLSESLQKPLIIHCTKAWDELLASKKQIQPKQPWIIHGYRGKPQLTKQLLKHGFYFSIGIHFNPESLKQIPINHLFCETDDSDIAIEKVYEQIAIILDIDIDSLCQLIENNVKNIFNIDMSIKY